MNFNLDELYIIEPIRSRVCAIGRRKCGEHLFLRAEGNRSLVDFFGPGGKGHDYTVHIQTDEGKVEIPVGSNTYYLTENTITLIVPSSGRHILNNIEEGTRFIFAMTRPK